MLDLVREKATGGSAPLDAIELDAVRRRPLAEGLRQEGGGRRDAARPRAQTVEPQRRRGPRCARVDRAGPDRARLYVARVESNPDDNGITRDDWFWIAGVAWLGLIAGLRALRAIRYSPAGEAAAHAVARRRSGSSGTRRASADAPPASVAIWNRLLAVRRRHRRRPGRARRHRARGRGPRRRVEPVRRPVATGPGRVPDPVRLRPAPAASCSAAGSCGSRSGVRSASSCCPSSSTSSGTCCRTRSRVRPRRCARRARGSRSRSGSGSSARTSSCASPTARSARTGDSSTSAPPRP